MLTVETIGRIRHGDLAGLALEATWTKALRTWQAERADLRTLATPR
jgi:hypothetical protein